MRRISLAAGFIFTLLLVLVFYPATVSAAEGQFDRTLKVTGMVDLKVETGSGSIRVMPGSSAEVVVHGRIKSGFNIFSGGSDEKVRYLEKNPPVEQQGNVIRIGHIKDRYYRDNISISYEITVPSATRVQAGTGSGSVQVTGIDGPVKADTGSGSVTIRDIKGKADADTGSGSVHMVDIGGGAAADTGSGSVELLEVAGPVHANTGSGSVTIRLNGPGDVDVDTGSGGVDIEGADGALTVGTGSGSVHIAGNPAGNWNVETGSGSITLRMAPSAGFDLDAETDSSSISVQLPVTSVREKSRHEFRGEIRGGGALVRLSSNGSITVK